MASPAAPNCPRSSYTPLHIHQQHRPQLQHLPIARDRHGESVLQKLISLHSPRSAASFVACEGSPTANVLCRAFPDCNASKYSKPEAVLSALEGRQAYRALLAVESSVHGTVHRTYDLLLRYSNVQIVGELVQQQQLSPARLDVAIDSILEQEREYGRFWMLSRDPCVQLGSIREEERALLSFKTTVAMVLREGLSALHKVLAAFTFRGISVSKVESRPWRAQPLLLGAEIERMTSCIRFQYVVFIDFEGSTAGRAAQNALAQLQEHSSFLRVLGSYPCFHCMTSASPRLLISPLPQTAALA